MDRRRLEDKRRMKTDIGCRKTSVNDKEKKRNRCILKRETKGGGGDEKIRVRERERRRRRRRRRAWHLARCLFFCFFFHKQC